MERPKVSTYQEFMAEAERLDPDAFARAKAELAEIKALRIDAERYRWLRNYRPGLILDMLNDHEIPNEQWAADLDQIVDSKKVTPN